jgi:hypothetical protein
MQDKYRKGLNNIGVIYSMVKEEFLTEEFDDGIGYLHPFVKARLLSRAQAISSSSITSADSTTNAWTDIKPFKSENLFDSIYPYSSGNVHNNSPNADEKNNLPASSMTTAETSSSAPSICIVLIHTNSKLPRFRRTLLTLQYHLTKFEPKHLTHETVIQLSESTDPSISEWLTTLNTPWPQKILPIVASQTPLSEKLDNSYKACSAPIALTLLDSWETRLPYIPQPDPTSDKSKRSAALYSYFSKSLPSFPPSRFSRGYLSSAIRLFERVPEALQVWVGDVYAQTTFSEIPKYKSVNDENALKGWDRLGSGVSHDANSTSYLYRVVGGSRGASDDKNLALFRVGGTLMKLERWWSVASGLVTTAEASGREWEKDVADVVAESGLLAVHMCSPKWVGDGSSGTGHETCMWDPEDIRERGDSWFFGGTGTVTGLFVESRLVLDPSWW